MCFIFYTTHNSLDQVLNNKLFIAYSHLYNVAYHNQSLPCEKTTQRFGR